MDWTVRSAVPTDEGQVLEAIRLLCCELRSKQDVSLPATAGEVFQRIVSNMIPGTVLVAEMLDGNIIGCATVSVQEVIFRGGPYALIQELWVEPSYRSLSVGSALIQSVEQFCKEHSLVRLEVCLPHESFATFDKTHRFYGRVGFSDNGPYMAKMLARR